MEIASQRGFDRAHFVACDRAPIEAARLQKLIHFCGGIEVLLLLVHMQDAALLEIEVNPFALGDPEQMRACGDCKAHRLDGVGPVVGDLAQELAHPRILVPGGRGVQQQRCVTREHPAQALEHSGHAVPDLCVAGGKLAAVRKRCFHRRMPMTLENSDLVPALSEGVSGRDAGNTGANDGDS